MTEPDTRETQEVPEQVFHSRMEWLKTVYDFYKQFMTIGVASIAAVAALIGGAFKSSVGPQAPLLPQLFAGAAILAFLTTSYVSVQGMHMARINILHLHEVVSEKEFTSKLRKRQWGPGEVLDRESVWVAVSWSYAFGILAFVGFLVITIF